MLSTVNFILNYSVNNDIVYTQRYRISINDYSNPTLYATRVTEIRNGLYDYLLNHDIPYTVNTNTDDKVSITIHADSISEKLNHLVQIQHLFTTPLGEVQVELRYPDENGEILEHAAKIAQRQGNRMVYRFIHDNADVNDKDDELIPDIFVYSDFFWTINTDEYNVYQFKPMVYVSENYDDVAITEIYYYGGKMMFGKLYQDIGDRIMNLNRYENGLPEVQQGLDEDDNPNLEMDLLIKPNLMYAFERSNDHDNKVIQHSYLHYRLPMVIFRQADEPIAYVIHHGKVYDYVKDHQDYLFKTLGLAMGESTIDSHNPDETSPDTIKVLYVNKPLAKTDLYNVLSILETGITYA